MTKRKLPKHFGQPPGYERDEPVKRPISTTASLLSEEAKRIHRLGNLNEPSKRYGRQCIEVECIEFDEGGHTLWVQGLEGTVLRIKTSNGRITSKQCDTSPTSHADIMVYGNIEICIGKESGLKLKKEKMKRRLDHNTKMGFVDPRQINQNDLRAEADLNKETEMDNQETTEEQPSKLITPGKTKTTRDYIIDALKEGGVRTANAIHVEILANNPDLNVSLEAVQSSIKRLRASGVVDKTSGNTFYLIEKVG